MYFFSFFSERYMSQTSLEPKTWECHKNIALFTQTAKGLGIPMLTIYVQRGYGESKKRFPAFFVPIYKPIQTKPQNILLDSLMEICFLFVWMNKTRIVKPLGRFHPWRVATQDGPAFSTKIAQRHYKSN